MTKALLHPLGQSLSYGRLSLLAKVLWPMLLSTSDDQGRGTAEPDAIKWYVCPNVPEITILAIADLLAEMKDMIVVYRCDRDHLAYQIIRWHEYQSLRWARPSKYSPPDGWIDRIRYSDRGTITEENWDKPGGFINKNYIENYKENSTDNQPNLTQPNLTQLKKDDGANAPAAPTSYPDWLTFLKGEKNKTGALVFMYRTLYGTDGEQADYGRIGRMAKTAGSASSLANLLWMNATKGLASPLDYLTKAANNGNGRNNGNGSKPAGAGKPPGMDEGDWVDLQYIEYNHDQEARDCRARLEAKGVKVDDYLSTIS